VKLGYGQFSINEERYFKQCPGCGENVRGESFKNIGFRNAKIVIKGVMIGCNEDKPINQ
jgi:hypothetical protein